MCILLLLLSSPSLGFTHGQVEFDCGSMGGQGGLKTIGYVTDTLHWDKKGDLPENKGAERVQNSI